MSIKFLKRKGKGKLLIPKVNQKPKNKKLNNILISQQLVIETKNMKGWIFGNKDQKTWTQKIFKETHKFQNPLFQNYKHTKTLESLLGLTDQQIFSVIAFM